MGRKRNVEEQRMNFQDRKMDIIKETRQILHSTNKLCKLSEDVFSGYLIPLGQAKCTEVYIIIIAIYRWNWSNGKCVNYMLNVLEKFCYIYYGNSFPRHERP